MKKMLSLALSLCLLLVPMLALADTPDLKLNLQDPGIGGKIELGTGGKIALGTGGKLEFGNAKAPDLNLREPTNDNAGKTTFNDSTKHANENLQPDATTPAPKVVLLTDAQAYAHGSLNSPMENTVIPAGTVADAISWRIGEGGMFYRICIDGALACYVLSSEVAAYAE